MRTRITELFDIEHPVMLAGMGGVSYSDLVGAVSEAGGIIANFSGEADYLYKGDVIAGSPKIFGQMLNVLSPFA